MDELERIEAQIDVLNQQFHTLSKDPAFAGTVEQEKLIEMIDKLERTKLAILDDNRKARKAIHDESEDRLNREIESIDKRNEAEYQQSKDRKALRTQIGLGVATIVVGLAVDLLGIWHDTKENEKARRWEDGGGLLGPTSKDVTKKSRGFLPRRKTK